MNVFGQVKFAHVILFLAGRIKPAARRMDLASRAASIFPLPSSQPGAECSPRRFTVLTRASGSIGKVTMEISQRSIVSSLRTPDLGSVRPFTVRKPIESPSRAPARDQAQYLTGAHHFRHQPSAGEQALGIFVELEPHPDWLVGIMLEQQLDPSPLSREVLLASASSRRSGCEARLFPAAGDR